MIALAILAGGASLAVAQPAAVQTLTDLVLAPSTLEPEPADLALTTPAPPPPQLDDLVRAGKSWRLDTDHGPVHVWIPASYDPATAATIVFVHGYKVDVDEAWTSYRLPQQFALSGINAMFIAGEAPDAKYSRIAWMSLTALVKAVKTGIDAPMPAGRLVAVGHSGAYRTLAIWLANKTLDSIVLLDAVYGEMRFKDWVREDKKHRLINIAYETGRFSDVMHAYLPSTRRVDGLPVEGLPDARILYVKTDVGHWQLVTDGVALPLSLRALGLAQVDGAPVELPLGLPLRCEGQLPDWIEPEHGDEPIGLASEPAR